jgi:integrase
MMHRGEAKFFLLLAKVKDSTRKLYKKAVHEFIKWCDDNDISAETNDDLDWYLWEYIGEQYEQNNGAGRAKIAQLMAGLQLYVPQLRGRLPLSAQALAGWTKRHPSVRHPPLTWSLTVAIAAQLARWGRFDMAVGTLLAFACLLRIGELVALIVEDVLDASIDDPRVDSTKRSGVRFRSTKTGDNKFAELHDANVRQLLRLVIAGKRRSERVFSFSASNFRVWFKKAVVALGLDTRYVPHSLRHGAATALYMAGVPLETILVRGRWASTTSARHYVQSGESLLLAQHVPTTIRDTGRWIAQHLVQVFTGFKRRFRDLAKATRPSKRAARKLASPVASRHSSRHDWLVQPSYVDMDNWTHPVLPR